MEPQFGRRTSSTLKGTPHPRLCGFTSAVAAVSATTVALRLAPGWMEARISRKGASHGSTD